MTKVDAARITLKSSCRNHEVTMKLYDDGAVSLSSDGAEHNIYLYPEQVGVLKLLLSEEIQVQS